MFQLFPAESLKILIVLALSFLIGLEREERKISESKYAFGGVRTMPLIGLMGYAMALLSGPQELPFALGFVVVGGLMMLSYFHKLRISADAGITSEISGLMTYLLGAIIYHEHFWIASTLVVTCMLLLELKVWLEQLSKKLPAEEILTFTKFLLLTIVILPALPNQEFTKFQINPFKTWLIVTAISSVSYASYLIQKFYKKDHGLFLAALLGGAYSSTVTTVVLAKKSKGDGHAHLFSGAILSASGVMYLRLVVLIGLFSLELFHLLARYFAILGCLALVFGYFWSTLPDEKSGPIDQSYSAKNPLELHTAFFFSALFLGIVVATRLVLSHFGSGGVYGLAVLMGVTDVDPFILSMTQAANVPRELAAVSIVIAAASNCLVKGFYALSLSNRKAGLQSIILLAALSALGFIPLFILV